MVTYDAINMLFQFGIFLATLASVVITIIVMFTQKRK